jgi:hypothetical protein
MANSPTLLRALLISRHWQTYETFSHQYSRAANELAAKEGDQRLRNLSVSVRQFERWYGGKVQTKPRPDTCRVLEHMFQHAIQELLSPPKAVLTMPPTTQPVVRPAIVWSPSTGVIAPPAESIGYQETIYDSQAGFSDLGRQVTMAARRAFQFAMTAEGSSIGPEMLAQLQDDVRRLAVAYPRLPLSALFNDLVEVQDVAFRLLESGHQRPTQAREIYFLASIASGMLAKASHDLGDPRAAMMQARTAYVCADNADHNGMRAWVRGLQSLITYWAGQPQEAVRYAQLGDTIGSQSTGSAAIWLSALEARASAALGDDEAARRAIAKASDARDQVTGDELDSFGGILTFPHIRQLYYVADTAVLMSDGSLSAEELAQEAVAAYQHAEPDEWAFGDQAGSHTDLALARIGKGQLDGVREALQPVLDLPTEQRISGIVASTQQVHKALCASRWNTSPVAHDIRDEIEAFAQAPLKALPC